MKTSVIKIFKSRILLLLENLIFRNLLLSVYRDIFFFTQYIHLNFLFFVFYFNFLLVIMYVQTTRITVQCGVPDPADREEGRKRFGREVRWGEEATQVTILHNCDVYIRSYKHGDVYSPSHNIYFVLYLFLSTLNLFLRFFLYLFCLDFSLFLHLFYSNFVIVILSSNFILWSSKWFNLIPFYLILYIHLILFYPFLFLSVWFILFFCTSLHSTFFFLDLR